MTGGAYGSGCHWQHDGRANGLDRYRLASGERLDRSDVTGVFLTKDGRRAFWRISAGSEAIRLALNSDH